MAKNKKQREENRNQKAIREAKIEEDMKLPVNKLLNDRDKEGKLKFPLAPVLQKYFRANPDPALNAMRLANSLVHELRWHKDQAAKYLENYQSDSKVEMFDKDGRMMTKEECYTAHIQETQVGFVVLSKLRDHLINGLLPVVDATIFSLEQYNDFVMKIVEIVKGLGYNLFPETAELIEPL